MTNGVINAAGAATGMDGATLVWLALIGIFVPSLTAILSFIQVLLANRKVMAAARDAAVKVAEVAVRTEEAEQVLMKSQEGWDRDIHAIKEDLTGIHSLVNQQLTDAVTKFDSALNVVFELRELLLKLAPDDPRVQALISKAILTGEPE